MDWIVTIFNYSQAQMYVVKRFSTEVLARQYLTSLIAYFNEGYYKLDFNSGTHWEFDEFIYDLTYSDLDILT